MTEPEPHPTDEQLAALMATTDKDAPPTDAAFLDRLREQSLAVFSGGTGLQTGEAATEHRSGDRCHENKPLPNRKPTMLPFSLRWIAATAAALMLIGFGVAYWTGAFKQPIPVPVPQLGEPFVFQDGLTDDGRIGKVTDAQGVVAVKPVLHERWSPVQPRLVLKLGDWLRTDSRGANAVALKLVKSAAVIVGPHSTVELIKADELRLLAGEIEITATDAAPVELHGPDKQKLTIKGKQHFKVEKEKLVRVEKEPPWLAGFKGTTANESIGSLVHTVDGRDVPLTVGYHHVTVDIRDQIARTTIEESFVNRTAGVLEGVFHFPLPQDASISGFGMWIGDELVEADVVEKQRAREIYETILRERRDPGLLEWAGGNIFKARVFPILARSEKRIKITYTQVLPLRGNRYSYSYALQSELLKQHPLRDLKIDVKVHSATALKSISSPTHAARVAKTEHAGQVEFSAQEYTPTRDFEAVIEVEGTRPDVVVIPHRRGDDGYFLVQLTPPGGAGDWERPLVPNGDPLNLLLLADTSASMDKTQRATRDAVLNALLGALTPKDTINVAACDVNCDWVFEKPVSATPANVAAVQEFLAKRSSLGWTDLDKAFASAMKTSEAGTHVVYLGDGISTTGSADPVAFARRLAKLYEGKSGTFHAVAVGSSYEPAALKAIASLGNGSLRRVASDKGPQGAAFDLLTEIATPALRNLKVEFTGLRTARVYPDTLPNVPAGTQQILLGRYLPEGKDQSGEIVVTGMLGNKAVRYTSKVKLKDAEQGNSFVPRLWARMQLDALLEQGTSATVQQDVIALSEEFNIITPYTSLLVLETDADRARFGVKRRFQMRDGEKYFREGQENAVFALRQKQMKLAGDYRTALRRSVLAQLNGLGRNAFRGEVREWLRSDAAGRSFTVHDEHFLYLEALGDHDGGEMLSRGFGGGAFAGRGLLDDFGINGGPQSLAVEFNRKKLQDEFLGDPRGEVQLYDRQGGWAEDAPPDEARAKDGYLDSVYLQQLGNSDVAFDGVGFGLESGLQAERRPRSRGATPYFATPDYASFEKMDTRGGRYQPSYLQWLGTHFPPLAAPAREPKEPKTTWPAPALALSRGLLRTDALAKLKGGIVIDRQTDGFDPRRAELSSRGKRIELVSPTAWLGRTAPEGGQVIVAWCDAKECGAYSTAFQLGRVRASNKHDLAQPPLDLRDDSVTPLHLTYAYMIATVEAVAKDREMLILKHKDSPEYEVRVLIDTKRRVVLSNESRHKGKVTGTIRYDDFVEVAGQWWGRRVETLDAKNQRTALMTQTITEVPAADFAKRMAQELAGKPKVQFLKQPLPTVAEAKAAVVAGKATFDDRVVLTLYFASTQQWVRALEHFQEAEKLSGDKPGTLWLRDSFLLASRRHDELRKRILGEAGALAAATTADARANEYFLAEHIVSEANQVLQTNEQPAVSDALQKVYERQPAHLEAAKTWRSRRVSLFEQAGQSDKAAQLAKELATDYPRDYYLQYRYAQALANTGDYVAAYAWLDRVLAAKWEPSQEESLRGQYAEFLRLQGRYRELADYLAAWVKRSPESESPYSQYLSALVRGGQAERAEELVAQWLREARVDGELPGAVAARLNAAVAFATGNGYNLYTNRVDERWHAALAEVALFFARRDDRPNVVSTVLHSRYSNTDSARTVRKALAAPLAKEIDTLSVAQLDYLISLVWSDSGMERDDWKKVATALRKRWDAEKKPEAKHRLAQPLVRVLSWLGPDDLLPFLRVQWKDGPELHRVQYANELFNALLAQPWTPSIEDEAWSLLDKLAGPDEPANGLYTRVAALHRLTDAMLEARYSAKMKTVEHREKLPRTDLQKKQEEFRKSARESFADRLRAEAPKHAKPFANWLVAERVWLDVLLERDLKAVAEECWTLLANAPKKIDPEDDNAAVELRFDEALRARVLVTLVKLAARKGADPALIERLVKYVDQQLKDKPDDTRWRAEKYRLLIALDRAKELEAELTRWVSVPDPDNRWRLALGYLLAEQGKVPEAIKQFEALEAADELSPAAYRSLADWYLVGNRRAEHEKARAAVYKTTDEYHLSNRINGYLSPWRATTGHLPTKLDAEVLTLFRVLFEKSATPQNYLWQLQQFYQASHDFTLLSMLPDGVIGHTAGKVYPFLQGMRTVLGEVRDEATADELVKRIAEVRPTAKTAVDHRALDLLELMVERRATEVQNQPGPHADNALAALERAFKREWSEGEPRLMADFLAALGNVPQAAIAKEQLRQLEALHKGAAAGSFDRLHIAHKHAETLDAYSRRPEATDLLQAALKEFEEANKGVLPTSANNALTALVSLTEAAGHYDRGEKILLAQLAHPVHAGQKLWLVTRLNELYLSALRGDRELSLGKGAALYKALERKLFADLTGTDQNHRYQWLRQITRMYSTAHELTFAGVGDDLKAFAFKRLPTVLKEQTSNYEVIVRDAANALRDLIGPRDAIAFLLDRIDDEPDWLRYTNQDAWAQNNYRLGEWRTEVKELGDLEPRLLKLVLTELRRDLRSRESRSRAIYDRHHSYYWAAKEADFAKAAEEVLAERKTSSASVEYIAGYLFNGLPRQKRAIEILFAAHEQKVLAESGRWQLADYLHQEQRFAESIPLLLPLVETRPENLGYRTKLMHAYFRTGKAAELMALLEQTDKFFHEKDRWNEGTLASLAYSCLENKRFTQSVAYYEELIPLHQRSHARRGIGNGTLSNYYAHAASAYSGLGNTKKAVEMASGAVVSWGPRHEQRTRTLEALVQVLVAAPDLAEYVVWLDKEPLQSAVVRKAVGKAYIQKGDHARAIPQLHLASELQPDDAEIYEALLVCFDKVGDKQGAVEQLLRAVELSRRDIKLYEQLGKRCTELKQPVEAERAYTSVVEMLPNESEGHALLAEVREKQNRWPEAIAHWERVAEVRALEPTGLLKLAAAQIELKSWDAAAKTVRKLRTQSWPPRFNEVEKQTRELETKLEARPKK